MPFVLKENSRGKKSLEKAEGRYSKKEVSVANGIKAYLTDNTSQRPLAGNDGDFLELITETKRTNS